MEYTLDWAVMMHLNEYMFLFRNNQFCPVWKSVSLKAFSRIFFDENEMKGWYYLFPLYLFIY